MGGAAGKFLEVDCCNRALRGVSKGSVGSRGKLVAADCCDRALRGMSKGSVRSHRKLVAVDCCNRALRGVSKGSVGSHRKKNSRMSCCHRKTIELAYDSTIKNANSLLLLS